MRTAGLFLLGAALLVTVAHIRGDDTPPVTKAPSAAAPAPEAIAGVEDFQGKIAMVYMDALARSPSHVLRDVEVKEIGGHKFLVGVAAGTLREEDWREGKQIRISWALVTAYMLFTPEQYAQHIKEAKEEREDN